VAKRHITVNAIAPGFIRTDMTSSLKEEDLVKLIPVGRFGEAEEVEARGGSGECAQRTGDEGHCQEAVGFAQNAAALHAHGRVGIVVNIMLHGVVPMCGLVNKDADCNSKS